MGRYTLNINRDYGLPYEIVDSEGVCSESFLREEDAKKRLSELNESFELDRADWLQIYCAVLRDGPKYNFASDAGNDAVYAADHFFAAYKARWSEEDA